MSFAAEGVETRTHPDDIDVRYGFAVVRICRPCICPQAGAGQRRSALTSSSIFRVVASLPACSSAEDMPERPPLKAIAERNYRKILSVLDSQTRLPKDRRTTEDSRELTKMCEDLFENTHDAEERLRFLGVFSRDEEPECKAGEGYIINNQTTAQGGEHWLGIGVLSDGKTKLQYDSFGRANFLKLAQGTFQDTERDKEQDVKQTNCGNRCAAFLAVFFWLGEDYAKYI